MRWIDDILNRVTMYRLVLYALLFLVAIAVGFGFTGTLSYSPWALLFSAWLITMVCWLANSLFAWAFDAQTNVESFYITALILALIITPGQWGLAIWASVLAMASKYILAIGKKHLFNPVAVAVVLTAVFLNQSAGWWVGTAAMAPFVLLTGILIIRKIRRSDLVINFLVVALALMVGASVLRGGDALITFQRVFLDSPILFFVCIMLTEPLTTPPTQGLRVTYGILVGALFPPFIHIGSIASTPELALLVGNVFSYLVSPKEKLMLRFQEKIQIAPDIYDFLFQSDRKFSFRPGQYLEWTLGHPHPDSRGNRRYFTIASSPTESLVRMGVKFYENASSFKKTMLDMKPGQTIVAGQRAGDFTLPKDQKQKLVFIAGGIGVTPYRSMVKYLIDAGERRDVVLLYANKAEQDIVYRDVFDRAHDVFGLKAVYVTGRLDTDTIMREIPDYRDRMFYISGPHGMIMAFEEALKELGVPASHIKTDFFPGFV